MNAGPFAELISMTGNFDLPGRGGLRGPNSARPRSTNSGMTARVNAARDSHTLGYDIAGVVRCYDDCFSSPEAYMEDGFGHVGRRALEIPARFAVGNWLTKYNKT